MMGYFATPRTERRDLQYGRILGRGSAEERAEAVADAICRDNWVENSPASDFNCFKALPK